MNYEQARAYAVNVSRSGSILGLDSIENLMHELGDIQERLKIIHIAGTNGKGSTGAYLERVLIEAGYRVGRYSSPAVFDGGSVADQSSVHEPRGVCGYHGTGEVCL